MHEILTTNLKACVDTVANGNLDMFAKICHISRTSFQLHLGGRSLPSLDMMLRICQELRVRLTAFLESDSQRAAAQWERTAQSIQQNRIHPSARPIEEVRLALLKAVQEHPAPTLTEVAKRLGYKGTERLYQVDRDLCKRLAAKHRQSGRSHSWRKAGAPRISEQVNLRKTLEDSLALEHPVSAHHLAAELGYANDGYLQRKFPDLCRAIRQKLATRKSERLVAMERLLAAALNESPPPTLNDLRKRLGYSSSECLQLHLPQLCQKILARRQAAREQDLATLRRQLRELLLETPVVSLQAVSRQLDLSVAHLAELCPDECAAIRSRYVRWRHGASELRKARMFVEVREAVLQLHTRGQCPTVSRVMPLLTPGCLREWHALTTAVKAARAAIER